MTVEIRDTIYKDAFKVATLISSSHVKYFGYLPHEVLSSSLFDQYQTHRLMAVSTEFPDVCLAYAEISSFPNILALQPDCWKNWLHHHYCIDLPITNNNTLFLNQFVFTQQSKNTLDLILIETFIREHRLRYLLTVKPPELVNQIGMDYSVLEKFAIAYHPNEFSIESEPNLQTVFVVLRDTVLSAVQFRKALPEDNDDVIEIIGYEEPHVRDELGDYFIAEELLLQNEDSKNETIVIGETFNKKAQLLNSGFIWISDNVNIDELISNFYFEPYGNLLTFDPNRPYKMITKTVTAADHKPYQQLFTHIALEDLQQNVIMGGIMRNTSSTSIASKFKVGIISDQGYIHSRDSRFYEREGLFTKFIYIYQELRTPGYYVEPITKHMDVRFNVPWTDDVENLDMETASNAFQLKKFNLHPKQRKETAFYFLSATFCAYPERDYLIIKVHPLYKMTDALSEILKYCLHVSPRPNCKTREEIYITHRSSLYGELCIFKICEDDMNDILQMMMPVNEFSKPRPRTSTPLNSKEDLKTKKAIQTEIVREIMEDVLTNPETEFQFFTIRCGNSNKSRADTTFVGFIIIRQLPSYFELAKQFILPPNVLHLENEHAEIVALKLHPFFQLWSDEFFRMLAVRTSYFDFYHITSTEGIILPNDLTKNMMPVEPRRHKRFWFHSPVSENTVKHIHKQSLPQMIYTRDRLILCRHNLMPTKFCGNKPYIVIIGFSPYAKAFLRRMVFNWNGFESMLPKTNNCVPCLNITVITANGIVEAAYDKQFSCLYCESSKLCYIGRWNYSTFVRDSTHRIDLRNWIHFVSGDMVAIDRVNQTVNLHNNCKIYYDKLIFMCGLHFTVDRTTETCDSCLPHNYSQINRRLDKIILYHKMQELNEYAIIQPKILVFGANIAAFECVHFLLTHGIKSDWITMILNSICVENQRLTDPSVDVRIQEICQEMIIDLGVHVIQNATFAYWTLYANENIINTVSFKRDENDEIFTLDCDYYIHFGVKQLTTSKRRILSACGIDLSDNKIFVDENYCTNDPNIYALGNYVQMRKEPNYQYLNTSQLEAVDKLIHILGLDIYKEVEGEIDKRYSMPSYFMAILPLSYLYVKITMPKRYIETLNKRNSSCKQKVMTTFKNGDLCRVGCNYNDIVEEIVVLTTRLQHRFDYLEFFCGKHESMLNNLLMRYNQGLIDNFLDFFQEPWTELIMHDHFPQLQAQNKTAILNLIQKYEIHMTDNGEPQVLKQRQKEFKKEKSRVLQDNLLAFLRRYKDQFINEFALPENWRLP